MINGRATGNERKLLSLDGSPCPSTSEMNRMLRDSIWHATASPVKNATVTCCLSWSTQRKVTPQPGSLIDFTHTQSLQFFRSQPQPVRANRQLDGKAVCPGPASDRQTSRKTSSLTRGASDLPDATGSLPEGQVPRRGLTRSPAIPAATFPACHQIRICFHLSLLGLLSLVVGNEHRGGSFLRLQARLVRNFEVESVGASRSMPSARCPKLHCMIVQNPVV